MFQNHAAYLELIIGPMFSGKTSKLVQIYKQCKICDIPVIAINHINDNERNSGQGTYLTNHDNIPIPCVSTNDLCALIKIVDSYQVILINEGQFFHGLVPFVKEQLSQKKQIYIVMILVMVILIV